MSQSNYQAVIFWGKKSQILMIPIYSTTVLYDKHNNILLTPSPKQLFAYISTTRLKVLCSLSLISIDDAQCISIFHALEGNHGYLLSYVPAAKLGILQLQVNLIESPCNYFSKQYPTVFKGIGNLIGVEVMLHIDPEVSPVVQKPRRIPFIYVRK